MLGESTKFAQKPVNFCSKTWNDYKTRYKIYKRKLESSYIILRNKNKILLKRKDFKFMKENFIALFFVTDIYKKLEKK